MRKFSYLMPVMGGLFGVLGHFLGSVVIGLEWPRFVEAALYIGILGLMIIAGCVLAEVISPLINGYNWRRNYLGVTLKYLAFAALPALVCGGVMQGIYQTDFTPRVRRDVYMLIDISGSMEWNDPEDERLRAVERLAGATGPDERLEIIAFDHEAEVTLPIMPMGTDGALEKVRNAVRRMVPRGGTDLNAALDKALGRIDENGVDGRSPAVILLSDGVSDSDPQITGRYAALGVPVNTIGLLLTEKEGETVLENIALETGGKFVTVSDLSELDTAFSEVYQANERFILHNDPGFDIPRCVLYALTGGLIGFMTAFIFDNKPQTVPFTAGGVAGGLVAGFFLFMPLGLLPAAAALGIVFPLFAPLAKGA